MPLVQYNKSPPFLSPDDNQILHVGPFVDIFLGFEFQKDRLKKYELWGGRNFGLPIDKAHHL